MKGKRANITPEGNELIAGKALKTPRIKRTQLAEQLQREFEELGWDVPEFEVLERKISWYRNHMANEPEDKPWSLISLPKNPIPADAIPHVLKVWALALEEGNPLTIREAIWTAWLYPIFGEAFKAHRLETVEILKQAGIEEIKEVPPSLEDGELTLGSSLRLRKGEGMEAIATRELLAWARDYAIKERLLKLSGRDEYSETPDELLSFWFDDTDMFACLVGKE